MSEKEQLWYTRFLDYANSGLSQHRWCLEHGIPQSSFQYWIKKFNAFRIDDYDESPLPVADGQWYEVSCSRETRGSSGLQADCANTIRLQVRELKMEFPAETDGRMLLQIAKGLMRA